MKPTFDCEKCNDTNFVTQIDHDGDARLVPCEHTLDDIEDFTSATNEEL